MTRDTYVPTALWCEAEAPLLEKAKGDVLTILDCCFASGAIFKSRNQDLRNYQLLAASAAGRPTKGPGDKSFTKALCDSLEELLRECKSESFTLTKLGERINLKRNSQPALIWHRLGEGNRSIQLAPLGSQDRKDSFQIRDPERASLTLRFSLKEQDFTDTQIQSLAQQLPQAFKDAKIFSLRRIDWIKMAIAPEINHVSIFEIASAKRAMVKYRRRKSNAESEGQGGQTRAQTSKKRTRASIEDGSLVAAMTKKQTRSSASSLSPTEQAFPSPSLTGTDSADERLSS